MPAASTLALNPAVVATIIGREVDAFGSAFTKCLPASYQQYVAQVVVPQQTITQVLNPPTTNTQTKSYTVAGVDPVELELGTHHQGPARLGDLVHRQAGRRDPGDDGLRQHQRHQGGPELTIDKTAYKVVGLVNPTLTGDTSDIYFDLATLQSARSQPARVNEVLVKVTSPSDVNAVAAAIKKELPGAPVLTSKQLAGQVNGSLSNAKKLASHLGGGARRSSSSLAALLIAALLTLSSVAKRVREIGTLRAIGWSRGRVVGQIVAEMLGIGVVGAALGVLVGLGVCLAVNSFGPTFAYSTNGVVVGSSSASTLFHATTALAAAGTKTVKLHTSISVLTVVAAAIIAIVGALLAGLAGAWRGGAVVARHRPAGAGLTPTVAPLPECGAWTRARRRAW